MKEEEEVCVCPVGTEAKWVGDKGDRSAANRSGIQKVENDGFCMVSSPVLYVNHTPLGRV